VENVNNVALMALLFFALLVVLAAAGAIVWVFRERINTSTDLELQGRQDRLESNLKMLRDEWESYRSNLDTIVRRGIRLKVLEGRKEPPSDLGLEHEPAPAPLTRAELLKRALATRYNVKKEA